MADIYYPHDYLPIPQWGGYGLKHISPLTRTQMTSGRARQRRRYISTPTNASVKWLFKTDGQAQLFEAWFRDTLSDGVAWFLMRLKTPVGIKFYKCRFTDIYDGPTLLKPGRWQFSATLEMWERPLVAPGWGDFPQFIIGQNIIDLALNREWPKA